MALVAIDRRINGAAVSIAMGTFTHVSIDRPVRPL
jgi:hypothetical protein